MRKHAITLLLAVAFPYASASSIDVISKEETRQMVVPEGSIRHYADNISLAANDGWQRMSNGRVRAGPGIIDRFVYSECRENLTLIDVISKSAINASKIHRYCSGLDKDMRNPATHLALENIRNSLYLSLVGTNGKIDIFKFNKYSRENLQIKQPKLILNPQKTRGPGFTTNVVDCIAKIKAVQVFDLDVIYKDFSRDVFDRDLCVIDKDYGNKVMSAFLESISKANQ